MKGKRKMKIVIAAVCVIILVSGAFLLLRGGKEPKDPVPSPDELIGEDGEKTLLIGYTSRRTGTAGGDGCSSTVLYLNGDGTAEVHFFSRYEPDEKESHTAYAVDPSVIEEAYTIISENGISSWNEKNYVSALDGGGYELMFRTVPGEYVRVSSDCMPEDGPRIMGEVAACLARYTEGAEKLDTAE